MRQPYDIRMLWPRGCPFLLGHTVPEYRRNFVPGGTFFLTIIAGGRRPIFGSDKNVRLLRRALAEVRHERPFDILGAVILPNHMHFVWELPQDDADFSSRVGRMKVLSTRWLRGLGNSSGLPTPAARSRSQVGHRESGIWQRRFFEHTIRNERDFERQMDYIHYNPVKHELVECPHEWPFSSFKKFVEAGVYEPDWCCGCDGRTFEAPDFAAIEACVGE